MALTTLRGRTVDAEGRAIGGRAVLRLRDVSGLKRELAELNARHEKLVERHEVAAHADRALPAPVWVRDTDGPLIFVNAAYANAVEAKDADDAVARGSNCSTAPPRAGEPGARHRQDLLERVCRRSSPATGASSTWWTCRRAAAAPASASTLTEVEAMRGELDRMDDAHRRTLDQLATGVAIFGADQRLAFYNAAYRALWELDAASSTRRRPIPQCSTGCAHAQASRGDGFPRVEDRVARGLSRDRSQGASLASAGRPHLARRHHAQSRRAASPTCSTTSPNGSIWCGATTR